MSAPICPECAAGLHSTCSGDFAPLGRGVTCYCAYCRAWIDAEGPFSEPPDEWDA